jgi:FkbM family methyltransferase
MIEHHPIFNHFKFSLQEQETDWCIDGLGVRTRASFMDMSKWHIQFKATALPEIGETYFEWIDVLEAVFFAKNRFTMIELGAGFAPWLVIAATALRQISEIPFYLVAVEAEPTHFKWISDHFQDNGLNPREHLLINAAITDKGGSAWFRVGNPLEYGQSLGSQPASSARSFMKRLRSWKKNGFLNNLNNKPKVKKIEAITLSSILDKLDYVDLLDMDIQGAEFEVIASSIQQMTSKVKRAHIGTHGQDIEVGLRNIFKEFGWVNTYDFPKGQVNDTPYGSISFQDGVQSWRNPFL